MFPSYVQFCTFLLIHSIKLKVFWGWKQAIDILLVTLQIYLLMLQKTLFVFLYTNQLGATTVYFLNFPRVKSGVPLDELYICVCFSLSDSRTKFFTSVFFITLLRPVPLDTPFNNSYLFRIFSHLHIQIWNRLHHAAYTGESTVTSAGKVPKPPGDTCMHRGFISPKFKP